MAAVSGGALPASAPRPRPVAVTMGDPSGIGLEITLKAWRRRGALALPPFVLYADPDALAARAKDLDIALGQIEWAAGMDVAEAFERALPVRPVPLAAAVVPGRPDAANARAILTSIELATADVLGGTACALLTNPIAKSVLYGAGFAHPGHTEFLGALAEQAHAGRRYRPVMMLACEELRVVPLTIHIPLADVPHALDAELMRTTLRTIEAALRSDFGCTQPRIAVAGLNPHAGEDGTMGSEEVTLIAPVLEELRREGLTILGPLPADTMFHAGARRRYDAALAMYHDQALIPIKTLAFDRGVNVTLGLPFVRTSPDHGTAFDIAPRGVASPDSFIAALEMAHEIATRREGCLA